MKPAFLITLAAAAGMVVAGLFVSNRLSARHATELAQQQAAWQSEKANLEAALESAQNRARQASPVALETIQVTNRVSPAELLERLKQLRAGTSSSRSTRQAIFLFESLIEAGPAALSPIRQFLAQNLDVEYDANLRRGGRDGKIPTEFTMPPSLRLGLFEVVKNIGGEAGERLLAEVLQTTGRGAEVAYLAYALQELAPNKYREVTLAAAHDLLARPTAPGSSSPLDKFERDYLYGVLNFFHDGSYVSAAQAQMVQPDGRVDAVAVRYLQQTLGEQSIPVVAQAWQDTRIPAEQKEPLARVALTYAGVNPQADQLYQTAINDPGLSPDHRRNLIEDLNETGFADPKHLTQGDLALIQKRIGMIEQLAPKALDKANAEAFKEAYKDLLNMQNSLLPKAAPAK